MYLLVGGYPILKVEDKSIDIKGGGFLGLSLVGCRHIHDRSPREELSPLSRKVISAAGKMVPLLKREEVIASSAGPTADTEERERAGAMQRLDTAREKIHVMKEW